MEELELLIALQECDYRLRDLKKEICRLESGEELGERQREEKLLLKDYQALEELLLSLDRDIKDSDQVLKGNYFNLEDLEEKLYKGDIRDLKQLEAMSEEVKNLKGLTRELEGQTLVKMEKKEEVEKDFELAGTSLKDKQELIEDIKERASIDLKSLYKSLEESEKDREDILSNLSREEVRDYERLSENKIDFIVKLDQDKCLGCHMIQPVYLVDKVKKGQLEHCESCGRIIYI